MTVFSRETTMQVFNSFQEMYAGQTAGAQRQYHTKK